MALTRRLAAILVADVVGYSRLMEVDEAGTLKVLKALRGELIYPIIADHRGRVVKLMGDGSLVEFASAIDAVECAVKLQSALCARSAELPAERQLAFRIGINLGDVMVEGDDIYGDGVNVAARLEALAEPGGVYVSDIVRQSVGSRLELDFEDLGEHQVKNIARAVHVFRIRLAGDKVASELGSGTTLPVGIPHKPSIAVMPFINLTGEADQEFFSDGITEDIITALSKIRWFFVIAATPSLLIRADLSM